VNGAEAMRAHVIFGLVFSSVVACSSSDEAGTKQPAADSGKTSAPPPAIVAPSNLQATACRYVIPRSIEGTKLSCFDLTVPENRRNADPNKTIKLHFARIKGGNSAGIPTIELIGGPGGGGDDMVGPLAAGAPDLLAAYSGILAKGDLIVLDQRGIGRSVPRLDCDEDPSVDGAATRCRDALIAKGIDLAAYDTIENADDIHDLKVAIGADKIDLHGISYGTRLALEIVKRHADDVRSVVIDGVMPPDVPVMGMFPVALDGVLTKVFGQCAADAKCNAAYPSLDDTFTKLKAKLDATAFRGRDPDTGRPMVYDWEAFVSDLIERSYEEGTAAHIPFWIHQLLSQTQDEYTAYQTKLMSQEDADYQTQHDAEVKANPVLGELDAAFDHVTDEDNAAMEMAQGMYNSVTCNDYAQHETLAAAKAAQAKIRVALQSTDELTGEFGDCDVWPKRPSDPTVQNPATYGGPVLVIGGDMDVATPVEWAKHVASSLPVHQFFEVPTGGHGLTDTCGGGLKGSFFANPSAALDGTCATNRKLDFYYEDATTTHAAKHFGGGLLAHDRFTLAQHILSASKAAVVTKVAKQLHLHRTP
jgi:pimeloyl-ACP methyl ester carboxylesterase